MSNIENKQLLREAFLESWIGFMALSSYLTAVLTGASQITIGGLAVLTAVLFMNGFAKSELFLTSQGSSWWRGHPSVTWLHHISGEGEMAGVLIGLILFTSISLRADAPHIHLPIAGALSLIGIMSAANMAIKKVIPIMAFIEKRLGVQMAVFIGALLSSMTGAAASVFVCEYFKSRIDEPNRADFATKFAAALGLGNGLFPFASPPILIIWTTIQQKLGWGIGSLLLFVGVPAIIYAFLITLKIGRLVSARESGDAAVKISLGHQLPLLLAVVLANILSYEATTTMFLNTVVGVVATFQAKNFNDRFGSWILGALIIALEIIGTEAEEFVAWIAISLIPSGIHTLLLGCILFYITAFISHFADNALASKLIISAAFATPAAMLHGDFLATSVILGALAGGFALIPGNLPNLPISRILSVAPNLWLKSAMKIYYSMIFFFIWLAGAYFVM